MSTASDIEFKALMAVTVKSTVFWVVMLCNSEFDILDEYIASIFRVKSKPNKKPAEAGSKMSLLLLQTEVLGSSRMAGFGQTTWHCRPQDLALQPHVMSSFSVELHFMFRTAPLAILLSTS
jgi:hypothetical protein